MSRNGTGTYTLPAGNPVVTGTTISSTWANNTLSDIATALTQSLAKDGQTVPTANIPMGSFKLTGLGAPTTAGDALAYGSSLGPVTATTGTFSGNVQMASLNGGAVSLRNKIINGNMRVAQRGTVPFTVNLPAAGTVQYTADRFTIAQVTAATSAVAIGGIISDNALSGSSKTHIYLQTTTAKATLAAGDYALIQQNIEGFNTADLSYGTASAKTVTISFRAAVSGGAASAVISVSLRNSATDRVYITPVTITNAPASYSVTIPGDTSGTWLTDSGVGLRVGFCCGAGSTFTTSTTNAWQAGSFLAATGTTNFLATATQAFNITDVQLEVGPVSTPIEFRPIQMELALCQRYYQQSPSSAGADRIIFSGDVTNLGSYSAVTRFPVQMRIAPPTVVLTNNSAGGFAATSGTATGSPLGILETRSATSTTTSAFFTSTYTASAEL